MLPSAKNTEIHFLTATIPSEESTRVSCCEASRPSGKTSNFVCLAAVGGQCLKLPRAPESQTLRGYGCSEWVPRALLQPPVALVRIPATSGQNHKLRCPSGAADGNVAISPPPLLSPEYRIRSRCADNFASGRVVQEKGCLNCRPPRKCTTGTVKAHEPSLAGPALGASGRASASPEGVAAARPIRVPRGLIDSDQIPRIHAKAEERPQLVATGFPLHRCRHTGTILSKRASGADR